MNTLHLVAFFVAVAVFILGYALSHHQRKRERLARICHRDPMTIQEFIASLPQQPKIPHPVVAEALATISNAIDVPRALIRASDRFDTELAPPTGWEFCDGLHCLSWVFDDLPKTPEYKNIKIETVYDFICYYHKIKNAADQRS